MFKNQLKEKIFVRRTQRKYPQIWKHYCDLISHELMSHDELLEYNFKKRKEIIRFAYENTIFYRELYDSIGLLPGDINDESDWEKVPVVRKEMIHNNFDKLIAKGSGPFRRELSTGGSTGKPLKLYDDNRSRLPTVYWRARGWMVSRKKGELYSDTFPIIGQDEANIWRLSSSLRDPDIIRKTAHENWPRYHYYLDAQNMNKNTISDFIQIWKKHPPVFLYGYSGAIGEFAQYCIENDINRLTAKCVSGTSTPVNKLTRNTVKDAFNCQFYNMYASIEGSFMAVECNRSGEDHHLHVASDIKHLDILDENTYRASIPDVEGRVALTVLDNKVFPFIKYLLGDRSKMLSKSCDCGLPFPCIAEVQGRETDYLSCKDGTKIFGVSTSFNDYPDSVKGYQFVQHKDLSVTLRIIPNYRYINSEKEIQYVWKELQDKYTKRVDLNLKRVDRIPHDGGKIRFVIHENRQD